MNAIEYIKELKRMCDGFADCTGCPLCHKENGTEQICGRFRSEHPEKAVELVEKWSKEHPAKTVLQDFLEKYPNAFRWGDGTPKFCPMSLGYKSPIGCCYDCVKCWNTPLE